MKTVAVDPQRNLNHGPDHVLGCVETVWKRKDDPYLSVLLLSCNLLLKVYLIVF